MNDTTQLVNENAAHAVHPGLHDVYAPIPSDPPAPQEQPQIEPESRIEEAVAQSPQEQQETQQQKSFRLMRHKQEALEQEKQRIQEERDRYAYELNRLKQSSEQSQRAPVESNLSPDDYVERKYVDQRIQQLERHLINARLKAQYPDFDTVVSPSNVAVLEKEDPEFAAAIASSKDIYNVAAATYKAIKKMGIEGYDQQYENVRKLEQNSSKPRASSNQITSSKSETPLSRAHAFSEGLTSDMKKVHYADMKKAQRQSY